MRHVWECDAGCEAARKLRSIGISSAVSDVFEQTVGTNAIQGEVRLAVMLIKRFIGCCERLANVILRKRSHRLNPKCPER